MASGNALVIDEAQKAPAMFDQIKYMVDINKAPGQFVLLGSTEFSKELKIRESLLGRISQVRLFPMTLSETLEQSFRELPRNGYFDSAASRVTRPQLVRYLNRGGYPGMFAIRSEVERIQKIEDWLTLTCERDALLFPKLKGDPDLCRKILATLATIDEPSVSRVSQTLRSNPRKTATQFEILMQLFVIHRLNPHPLGTGKPLYFLNDPGIATHLGADFARKLETATLLEQLARRAYSLKKPPGIYYYRTSKGARIHLVTEIAPKILSACKIVAHERFDRRELEILAAFAVKARKANFSVHRTALGGTGGKHKEARVALVPWEALF